ncbi:2'-5' RNA ligase family protein [Rothia sp. AR01]|uniref:2'-5' RNA ligase family protein n=1 Tax=Rothia santali TaxID=2949643 RepID=A0A9X2HCC9_9MICC|nr:2'-5' RNA ligase family protein [Rothia santali]MCP3426771.1 2'-5' RNA ligase family protein [Rothia santali]
MPQHSLDLLLDPAADARVRERWAALDAAGLPSQARHGSPTNAPHLTVLAAPAIGAELREEARRLLADVLPAPMTVDGVVVLGRGPYVVADLVLPPPGLLDAVARLRASVPLRAASGYGTGPWLPHLTLARRVQREDLPAVFAALAEAPGLDAAAGVSVRRWDPDAGTVHPLVGEGAEGAEDAGAPPR